MVNTEYFSYTDAMKYMGIKSPVTFREYVKRGLPIIVIGKSKRISKTAIDEFMKAHTVTNKKRRGERR